MYPIPIFGVESSIPAKCGGLSFSKVDYYNDPRLGVDIRYDGTNNIYADAYLYNLGIKNITNDLKSQEIMSYFNQACNDILMMAEKGLYQNVEKVMTNFIVTRDNPEPLWIWAEFVYNLKPGPGVDYRQRMSHLALSTDRGFINKVRFTYPYIDKMTEVGMNGFYVFLGEWRRNVQSF
jgi:hypothetical protein